MQSVFVRLVGSLLQLLLSLVLAHTSGAAVLGDFLVFVALANIVAAVGGGLPNLMLRHASVDGDGDGSGARVGWLWRHGLGLAVLCGAVAIIALGTGATQVRDMGLAVAGILVQRISSATVKAARRPSIGVLLDTAVYPLVVLTVALTLAAVSSGPSIEVLRGAYVVALWLAALVAVVLGWRSPGSPRHALTAPRRTDRRALWEIATVTVGSAATVVAANAPLAIAPLFLGPSATGAFGLALRVAGFATTVLVALTAYFGPAFARAATADELRSLRRESQVACLLVYLPVLGLMAVLPTAWLEAVSPELGSVKGLVLVLSVGYLVNAGTGLASPLMLMRGWTGSFSRTNIAGAVLTVACLVIGGAIADAVGMAAGLSAAMVATNLWTFRVSTSELRRMNSRTAGADVLPLS
jgi:O-antigen/teichoic acid export membrane protein